MTTDDKQAGKNYGKHLAPVLLFAVLGFAFHTLFFIGVLVCLVYNMPTRNQKIAMALIGGLCVLVAFGYSVGKDMAVRDARVSAAKMP